VWIGSATKIWAINDPPVLLAALFGTSLAPISGHYGWLGDFGRLHQLVRGAQFGRATRGDEPLQHGFSAGIVATVWFRSWTRS
jgi:hypothetical protein